MRGILRTQQRAVRPAAALTSVEVRKLLYTCDNGHTGKAALADLRDRALLLTCPAGALRCSELVAPDRKDVIITDARIKRKSAARRPIRKKGRRRLQIPPFLPSEGKGRAFEPRRVRQ
jgi:integrase